MLVCQTVVNLSIVHAESTYIVNKKLTDKLKLTVMEVMFGEILCSQRN